MVNLILGKTIISLVLIVVFFLINLAIKSYISRKVTRGEAKEKRAALIRKIINNLTILLILFSLISIWGLNFDNLWVYLTSVLALIAVGFVAVWSILSNVLAGLLLFFTGTVRVGDKITLLTDKVTLPQEAISGKVKHISTLFVELVDEESNTIYIPNNLLFQRVIKKSK